jgi:YD repeat-containing protein
MRKPFTARRLTMNTTHRMCWLSQAGKVVIRAAALASIGLVINSAVVHSSAAQLPPPEFSLKDENSVDLLSFGLYLNLTDLSIGSKEHPLTHTIFSGPLPDSWAGYVVRDSFSAYLDSPWTPSCGGIGIHPYFNVIFGNVSEYFPGCFTNQTAAASPTGSTLTGNNYTRRDGTIIVFPQPVFNLQGFTYSTPNQILYPDGRVLTYGYCADGPAAGMLCTVTRSDGMQLKYNYTTLPSGYLANASVTAINNAYEYCNPTASACSLTMTWPTVTYSWSVPASGVGTILTVTDPVGRQTRYTQDGKARTVGIKLPSSASADNITYTYCDSSSNWCSKFTSAVDLRYQNWVQSVTRDGQTWNYSGDPGLTTPNACGIAVYSATNPAGDFKKVSLNYCFPGTGGSYLPGYSPFIQLEEGSGTKFNTGVNYPILGGLIKNAVKSEGNITQYTWDSRGNITQETLFPKPGSPLAQVPLSANYDTTCTVPVKCNKPNWVKDGNGNETDYMYDPTHGGMLTATLPPDANGIRPQTRYTYTQRYAWVLNASGAYVQSAAPIWVAASESYCRTSRAASSTGTTPCIVAGDEVVKTYEYGPNSGPNNLFLRGVAVTADAATHRTCYGYDRLGNRISETQPAAGLTSCP